ncbi:MAG: 2-amino-4-hydroxy-6-hydroxymethyldihydropteridine diphosphokinase [Bacteroidales bacterium]|nr:2-amino-4-hydroxy-6-hydroxymethyldihydropteridine diphosphokinase [Bacteroidales bacterium]MCF8351645.1 2-amino-4-hydroxy-6-hydroxymethyldihydropteridine diphosphokinase [Bacteroidales bacterium]MCF8376136.1 2-amino-4-hydroxy-6-hydroxymethyldihydropteridine diphosphokinase [Bacteroidales bacterium]
MKYPVYFSLGSNLGNRKQMLSKARELIESRISKIEKASSVYESEAWGFNSDKPFLNQVIKISTALPAIDILHEIQKIESKLGREKTEPGYKSRLIDIDILLYGDQVIRIEDELIIPHPLMSDRLFVLHPLAEVDTDLKHPEFNKTIGQMLEDCRDTSWITKLDKGE